MTMPTAMPISTVDRGMKPSGLDTPPKKRVARPNAARRPSSRGGGRSACRIPRRLVVELRQRLAREHHVGSSPTVAAMVAHHEAVVPGKELDLEVQLREVAAQGATTTAICPVRHSGLHPPGGQSVQALSQ